MNFLQKAEPRTAKWQIHAWRLIGSSSHVVSLMRSPRVVGKLTHRSFTSWLRHEAEQEGKQPSVLWRDFGALQFYLSLGTTFDGFQLPKIDELGPNFAPQHLELIEKLMQVANRSEIRCFLEAASAGTLRRQDLLDAWQIYKGKTSVAPRRGRGVSLKERENRRQTWSAHPSELEAFAIRVLTKAGSAWTGHDKPHIYKVIALSSLRPPIPEADLLIVLKNNPNDDVVLHMIEVKSARSLPVPLRPFTKADVSADIDYFWIAVPDDDGRGLGPMRGPVGLLHIGKSMVTAVWQAKRLKRSDQGALRLLARILTSRV